MNPWLLGGILTLALLIGGVFGWFVGAKTGIRMPNAWVAALILTLGAVGGPALTTALLGKTALTWAIALFVAGFPAGWSFWPMSLPQGKEEWL